jgi:hypothetical protein
MRLIIIFGYIMFYGLLSACFRDCMTTIFLNGESFYISNPRAAEEGIPNQRTGYSFCC